jgi:hypothetical protein
VVSSLPRFSVVLVVAAAVGCGSFGYHPFTALEPEARADSSIVVASLRLRIHVADERIDVRLENIGADTIVVDWASASFTISLSPDDEIPHRLIRSAMLANTSLNASSRTAAFAAPVYVVVPFPDQTTFRIPPDDQYLAITPHDALDETLYPAEHVRARPDGRWIVGPLFCRQSPHAPRRITVAFGARIDGRWRTVSIQGIVSQ